MPKVNYENLVNELVAKLKKNEIKFVSYEDKPKWLSFAFAFLKFFSKIDYKHYTQCINKTIYLPYDWKNRSRRQQYYTLVHEATHAIQFKKYGLFLMSLLYLFIPFPVVFAWFRAKFEREAKRNVFLEKKKLNEPVLHELEMPSYISTFSSSSYLWMWPFKKQLKRWYRKDAC